MLSAAPSPAPPTSAEVEEMAIIMFESAGINIRWTDPHVTEGRRHLWRAAARKAISAMNQRRGMERPTLSPEDRARVEALLRDALDYTGQRYAPIDTEACNEYARLCDTAHDKVREALSLIDKLAGEV